MLHSARRSLALLALALAPGGCWGGDGEASPPGPDATIAAGLDVTRTKIGSPAWEPVGWVMYGAAVGIPEDGFRERITSILNVVGKHKYFEVQSTFGPRYAHDPSYDREAIDAVADRGYPTGSTFSVADWTAPAGIFLVGIVVPTAAARRGSSPDFEAGPILPHDLFPLDVDGDLSKDGSVVDGNLDVDHPALTALTPPVEGDGYSHLVLPFSASTVTVTGDAGAYELAVTLTDAHANGWEVRVPFAIQ